MKRLAITFTLVLAVATTAWSQDSTAVQEEEEEWIEADRPDNTDSPNVLQPGRYQLEGGILHRRDTDQQIRQTEFLYPRMLLRIGLFEFMELRFSGDHRSEKIKPLDQPGNVIHTRDINALTVGTKVRFYEGTGLVPSVGAVVNVTLPYFSAFAPLDIAPMVRLAFSHELSESLAFQYNLGWERAWEEGVVQSQLIYTMALEKEFSKRFVAFVEVFGEKPLEESFSYTLDGGLIYRAHRNLQFDVWAGKGLSADAPDFFIGTGFGLRLPK